jgi:hypothetical protein
MAISQLPWCLIASAASVPGRPSHPLPPSSARACEVRRHRQFTKPSPIFLAAGLMCRLRMLLSRIGAPSLTDWNTRSSGPSALTTLYRRVWRIWHGEGRVVEIPGGGLGVSCAPKVPCRSKVKTQPCYAWGEGVTRHQVEDASCKQMAAQNLIFRT